METILNELLEQKNVRQNLSALRQSLKDGADASKLKEWIADREDIFLNFLSHVDAKTRKNAALLLGDIGYQNAAAALYEGYEKEQTLFVRGAYLEALEKLNAEPFLEGLRQHLTRLGQAVPTEENRKHIAEELRALRNILIRYDGIVRHSFDLTQTDNQVLLVTNRNHREVVRRMVEHGTLHPLGVLVHTDDLGALLQVRTYREMLFPMGERSFVPAEPVKAADEIAPWMQSLCRKYHKE